MSERLVLTSDQTRPTRGIHVGSDASARFWDSPQEALRERRWWDTLDDADRELGLEVEAENDDSDSSSDHLDNMSPWDQVVHVHSASSWSGQHLAQRLCVPRSTLHNYLCGRRVPPSDLVERAVSLIPEMKAATGGGSTARRSRVPRATGCTGQHSGLTLPPWVLATGEDSNGPRVVAERLDALWIGFYCEFSAEDEERLDDAIRRYRDGDSPLLEWGGRRWTVDSGGGQWARARLRSEHVALHVASAKGRNNPAITFRFEPHVLADKGWEWCWRWAEEMAQAIDASPLNDTRPASILQRVDLAVDLTGWDWSDLQPQDWVSSIRLDGYPQPRQRDEYAAGGRRTGTGWAWGQRRKKKHLQFRVYDKTLEIRQCAGADRQFDCWEDVDPKSDTVIRAEAGCYRTYLKAVPQVTQGGQTYTVDTLEGFRLLLPHIWGDVVGSPARSDTPAPPGRVSLRHMSKGQRQCDAPVQHAWLILQAADWGASGDALDLSPRERREGLASDLLPSAIGMQTRIASLLGLRNSEAYWRWQERQMRVKRISFEDQVERKLPTLNQDAIERDNGGLFPPVPS